MRRFLRVLSWIFAAAYAAALVIYLVGAYGLFGVAHDPLSGIFLVPLGLPWNLLADLVPVRFNAVVGILAPMVNLGILRWLSAPGSR